MTSKTTAQKTPGRNSPDSGLKSSAGSQGAAVDPPAYGIASLDGGALFQRKVDPSAGRTFPGTPVSNRTGLPDGLKSGVESLSGLSLEDVRVHYNSAQPAQLGALAYAQGTEIHIGPGQERHLPHEAWHIVQQKHGRVKPTRQMKGGVPLNDDQGLESEADLMGAQAAKAAQNAKTAQARFSPGAGRGPSGPALLASPGIGSRQAVQRMAIPGVEPPKGVKAPKGNKPKSKEYAAWENEKQQWELFKSAVAKHNAAYPEFSQKAESLWGNAKNPPDAFKLLQSKAAAAAASRQKGAEEHGAFEDVDEADLVRFEPKKSPMAVARAPRIEKREAGMPGLFALLPVSPRWTIAGGVGEGQATLDGNPLLVISIYRKTGDTTSDSVTLHVHVHTGGGYWAPGTISANLRAGTGNMNLGGDQAVNITADPNFADILAAILAAARQAYIDKTGAAAGWTGAYQA